MNIIINWQNLHSNEVLEQIIMQRLNKSFAKYKFLNDLELNISRGSSNSRFNIKLSASTKNVLEKLKSEGVSCDVIPALNDLIQNFEKIVKNYDENEFIKRQKLEEKWAQDAIRNKAAKEEQLAKDREIIEENKRRAQQNELIRKRNEQIKRDFRIQKDLAKKIHQQQLIDERTRYELEKDFLERQKALEEKRMLQEARLKEVSRIQKEIIAKDLALEEKYKEKKKELRGLKEEHNEVSKIQNEILQLEASDFDEVWNANEPFQNEETGTWYYHDGEGNFYESTGIDESGETIWNENTKEIKKELEKIKQRKIDALIEEKDKAQLRQEKVSNMEHLNAKDNSLDAKTLSKIEKDLEAQDEKFKTIVKEKEDKILNFEEKHTANEPWLDEEENKYYYHDGNGNYFTTNENNEWVKTKNPAIVKIEKEYDLKKQAYINTVIDEKPQKEDRKSKKKQEQNEAFNLPKPNEAYEFNGKWYYFDDQGNYFTTNENNEWVSTINPHATGTTQNNQSGDDKTKAMEDNYDHSEPFLDENGVWWYIDENNQYYYGDENGNWVKWEEKN